MNKKKKKWFRQNYHTTISPLLICNPTNGYNTYSFAVRWHSRPTISIQKEFPILKNAIWTASLKFLSNQSKSRCTLVFCVIDLCSVFIRCCQCKFTVFDIVERAFIYKKYCIVLNVSENQDRID